MFAIEPDHTGHIEMDMHPVSPPSRYVFVAGLHRTGTSLLARLIGSHPQIASIQNAPIPENEGCYLQGAIPHTAQHGVPGQFATDPAQHLTENHPLNTLESRRRLEADWAPWFEASKPWRLEKSPVNLTRTRLLQSLFPLSQFIIVTRHPLYMAHALQKWSEHDVERLCRYGVTAYLRALEDSRYLHSVMIVRYEDLVAQTGSYIRAIEHFLALDPAIEPSFVAGEIRDGNQDYDAAPNTFSQMAELGYCADGRTQAIAPDIRHPLRAVRESALSALNSASYSA